MPHFSPPKTHFSPEKVHPNHRVWTS
jgi:hypothetical protein